ncbi:MAG: GPP34 family phosphoprotein [Acidobacteria bacterium]|nr:GPP34 family phosphoprotein [Acidobacteriota bacterium]
MTGSLTFCEEILVLLLNDERGTLASIQGTNLDCVLAGAALMDLAFAGRIDTDPERLFVVDRAPTGNLLLDPVLATIAAREETANTLAWLRALAAEDAGRIREQALVLLVRRGMLERREGSFNAVFARWPEAQGRRHKRNAGNARARRRAGRRIERRVRDALLSDGIPDSRDIALIGLIDACGLLGEAVPEGDAGRLRPRVAQLRRLDLIGRVLARAVSEIERGVARSVAADVTGRTADGPRTGISLSATPGAAR